MAKWKIIEQKELKEYIVKDIHDLLESEGFWNE